jgi:hypothetical protein
MNAIVVSTVAATATVPNNAFMKLSFVCSLCAAGRTMLDHGMEARLGIIGSLRTTPICAVRFRLIKASLEPGTQGLLPFFAGIGNHTLDACLGLSECRRSFGGEIILRGVGRMGAT